MGKTGIATIVLAIILFFSQCGTPDDFVNDVVQQETQAESTYTEPVETEEPSMPENMTDKG